ncbi:MAG: RNA ligase [Acidimicrobiales bacterium]
MTSIADLMDADQLEHLISRRYITRRRLEAADVFVLNYTAKAAYERVWTPETRRCRGLVVDGAGAVLARPFEKFFDLEPGRFPGGAFEVTEKIDGSLGIVYPGPNGWAVTTRGDPNGWQSRRATALLRDRYGDFSPPVRTTLLVEIILPGNRVVVDYGATEDLVALAAIDITTGRDVAVPEDWPGPVVQRHEASRLDELRGQEAANREGFVLYWPESGMRAKLKFERYKALHRLIFSTSTSRVWEVLASGGDPVAALGSAPADLTSWVEEAARDMSRAQAKLLASAASVVAAIPEDERLDRRAAAARILAGAHPSIAFALLDGQTGKAAAAAWKAVRPASHVPFRREEA